jgi:MFS transporter, DHA2 family, glioxin efflux transporter
VCQAISGAYFVTVAQSLFANRMIRTLQTIAPNIDTTHVLSTGASEIRHVFQGSDLLAVLSAYMTGIKDVFAFSLATSAFVVCVALLVPLEKLPDHSDN